MNTIIIREIKNQDNEAIAELIRSVLIEMNVPKVGTAYADPHLDFLFETYLIPKAVYYIAELEGKILGGAGIMQLENSSENICELQKMYFLPEARGLGLGRQMMDICLAKAKEYDFEKCYLETMPFMKEAQLLYIRVGFKYLEAPIGNTGHNSCPIWMIKEL